MCCVQGMKELGGDPGAGREVLKILERSGRVGMCSYYGQSG